MKSIVTIFTEAKDVHLVKDVGQVINYLSMGGQHQATLVTYKNEEEYKQLKKEAKNILIKFIKNYGKIFNFELGIIIYLVLNSQKIDILNLYGNRTVNLIYILVYKKLNKTGFTYIKMDDDIVANLKKNKYKNNFKLKEYFYRKLSKYVDLYSVETKKSFDLIKEKYKEYINKITYLPNCVNDIYIDENIALKNNNQKENIILVVGRVGAKQKNHELLLKVVEDIDLNNWKLIFIGAIDKEFKKYIDIYFQKNKNKLNNIIFKGEINDRDELYEWYNRSKIFCLPSRYENFSLACIEALYFGNWIIATKMTSTDEILMDGQIGDLFEAGNESELKYNIKKAISDGFLSQYKQNITYTHALSYRWSEKIKIIKNRLPE